jgi:hypothetical protein
MPRLAHARSGTRERTEDVAVPRRSDGVETTFASLLLAEPILEGLHRAGFTTPSPIQARAIPLGRCGIGEWAGDGAVSGWAAAGWAWKGIDREPMMMFPVRP